MDNEGRVERAGPAGERAEVIGRRVARLAKREAVRVLSIAAVISGDFDLSLLAAAAEWSRSPPRCPRRRHRGHLGRQRLRRAVQLRSRLVDLIQRLHKTLRHVLVQEDERHSKSEINPVLDFG